MHFNLKAVFVPGKELVVANALSRNPVDGAKEHNAALETEIQAYVDSAVEMRPASPHKLEWIRTATAEDTTLPREVCQEWLAWSC